MSTQALNYENALETKLRKSGTFRTHLVKHFSVVQIYKMITIACKKIFTEREKPGLFTRKQLKKETGNHKEISKYLLQT